MVDGLIVHMPEFPIDALMKRVLLFCDGLSMYALLLTAIQYFLSIDVLHFIIITSNDLISSYPSNGNMFNDYGLYDKINLMDQSIFSLNLCRVQYYKRYLSKIIFWISSY